MHFHSFIDTAPAGNTYLLGLLAAMDTDDNDFQGYLAHCMHSNTDVQLPPYPSFYIHIGSRY